MNSKSLTNKRARARANKRARVSRAGWADLPTELLGIIFGGLQNQNQNHVDLVRFRSVCRSWRFSVSPPPYKLSPFFPLTLPYPENGHPDLTINASAVYLLRLRRRDPWKSWMLYVQESVTGKLVLRHALTYVEIARGGLPGNLLKLSSDDWIRIQVARSYSHNMICERCNPIKRTQKIAFVTNSGCGKFGSIQLAGLCKTEGCCTKKCVFFELGFGGEAREIKLNRAVYHHPQFINDFVKLKGWVYAIDEKGNLYMVDYKKSRLLRINCKQIHGEYLSTSRMWLVVSEGDLYLVLSFDWNDFFIHRLLIIQDDSNGMIERGEWRKVEDLGERVFFLTRNCSYSVSARDLPHPWKGNCIVYVHGPGYCCDNPKGKEIGVFFVGGQNPRLRSISSLQGYSDLFDPPSYLDS